MSRDLERANLQEFLEQFPDIPEAGDEGTAHLYLQAVQAYALLSLVEELKKLNDRLKQGVPTY